MFSTKKLKYIKSKLTSECEQAIQCGYKLNHLLTSCAAPHNGRRNKSAKESYYNIAKELTEKDSRQYSTRTRNYINSPTYIARHTIEHIFYNPTFKCTPYFYCNSQKPVKENERDDEKC